MDLPSFTIPVAWSTSRPQQVTESYFTILEQIHFYTTGRASNNIDQHCTVPTGSAMRLLHVDGNIPASRPKHWFVRAPLPSFRLVSLVTSNTALIYDPSEYPPRQLSTPLHGFPDCSPNSGDTTPLINNQTAVCRSGYGRVRVRDHRSARPIVVGHANNLLLSTKQSSQTRAILNHWTTFAACRQDRRISKSWPPIDLEQL